MKHICKYTLNILSALVIFLISLNVSAQTQYQKGPFTPENAPIAPEWKIAKWIKGEGSSLADLKGQVVIIDFFQLWCPGCNKFSIPLMSLWEKEFAPEISSKKLSLISIHTVFEGHEYQTNKRLQKFIKEKKFGHPVGVDNQSPVSRLPDTMRTYQTYGTPEMAFIDKKGRLRFQKFGYFDPEWATTFVRQLLSEKS